MNINICKCINESYLFQAGTYVGMGTVVFLEVGAVWTFIKEDSLLFRFLHIPKILHFLFND